MTVEAPHEKRLKTLEAQNRWLRGEIVALTAERNRLRGEIHMAQAAILRRMADSLQRRRVRGLPMSGDTAETMLRLKANELEKVNG